MAWRPVVSFVLVLAALTLGLHRDLLSSFASSITQDLGDPLLNTWILWWNAHHLPLTTEYWNAPAFAPAPYALALSETLLGLTWFTTPLQWLGASPVEAYNAMYVAVPVLNGLGGYALGVTLTRRHDAAAIAGLALAFAPYQASQLSHIQTQQTFWMPLALVGLHRYWQTSRAVWLGLLAGAFIANGLTCGYFLLYFAPILALGVLWLTVSTHDVGKAMRVTVVLAVAALAFVPVIGVYRSVHRAWRLFRTVDEIQLYGVDLSTVVTGADSLFLWPFHPGDGGTAYPQYPGLVIVGVVIFGLVKRWSEGQPREAAPWSWRSRLVAGLSAAAVVLLLIGVLEWVKGPSAIAIGPWAITLTRPYKPIGVALDMLLAAALLGLPFARALRSGSLVGLYATGVVVCFLLSLGPVAQVFNHRFWYKPPYAWLMSLPGFDTARVPALFTAVGGVCLAALAALAVAQLTVPATRRARLAVVIVGALIVVDGWSLRPAVALPLPPPSTLTADLVVELPTRGWVEDAAAMYRGMLHGRPVVNGYSGFLSPHYTALLIHLRQFRCLDSLDATRGGRSLDVVIWRDDPEVAWVEHALRTRWTSVPREETPRAVILHIPRDGGPISTPTVDNGIDLKGLCPDPTGPSR